MSGNATQSHLGKIVDGFIAAYNAKDFARCSAMLAPRFHFCHYNRGFSLDDGDTFIATLRQFATDFIPDRQFGAATRTIETGNTVVRTHSWGGTAVVDVPGMAHKGERIALDLCTIFVFDGDLITEYHDYG
jgi:hypothetical protein